MPQIKFTDLEPYLQQVVKDALTPEEQNIPLFIHESNMCEFKVFTDELCTKYLFTVAHGGSSIILYVDGAFKSVLAWQQD